jgi:hypothetical protein
LGVAQSTYDSYRGVIFWPEAEAIDDTSSKAFLLVIPIGLKSYQKSFQTNVEVFQMIVFSLSMDFVLGLTAHRRRKF